MFLTVAHCASYVSVMPPVFVIKLWLINLFFTVLTSLKLQADDASFNAERLPNSKSS